MPQLYRLDYHQKEKTKSTFYNMSQWLQNPGLKTTFYAKYDQLSLIDTRVIQ